MRVIDMNECCLALSDGEDKLSSLRLRKVRLLLKWLRSVPLEYAIVEDIDIGEMKDLEGFLHYEEMCREIQRGDESNENRD